MGATLDVEVRDTLTKLAQQLFPLEGWIKDPQKYVPPNAAELPWRKDGAVLSIASLRVMDSASAYRLDAQLLDATFRCRHCQALLCASACVSYTGKRRLRLDQRVAITRVRWS